MILRILCAAIILISSFVLQGTVFEGISFAGTVPNLILIFTVSVGIMRGQKSGMFVGFFGGLLMDVFVGPTIGFYALILMYIGYANGYFNKIFYPEDIKLPLGMVIVSDLLYGCVSYVLLFLLRGRLDFSYYFVHIILSECVYTILLTVPFYPLIFIINRFLEQLEQRRAKKFV